MKEMLRLVFVLTVIGAVSGLLLAYTSQLTREPIAAAQRAEQTASLHTVLPVFDNHPDADAVEVAEGGRAWTFYVATREGKYVGCAFRAASDRGYGGRIEIMVGVTPEGLVHAIDVLKQSETPGLGAKVADEAFRAQFAGKPAAGTVWKVRKDGGDIEAVTGATISSRAVAEAAAEGLDAYGKHKAEIRAKAGG